MIVTVIVQFTLPFSRQNGKWCEVIMLGKITGSSITLRRTCDGRSMTVVMINTLGDISSSSSSNLQTLRLNVTEKGFNMLK